MELSPAGERALARLTELVSLPTREALGEALTACLTRYDEPHRHYHTATHVEQVLREFDALSQAVGPAARERGALALLYHDCVYDPARRDNEDASARLWERDAKGRVSEDTLAEVARLIMLTVHHHPEPGDELGALVTDADLAILGAEEGAYEQYVRAVRREYGQYSEEEWRVGRAGALRGLLAGPRLLHSPGSQEREAKARANLARELEGLCRQL